jgi:N-acylglucosamine-6-phosphate 2-epimerase
MNVLNLIKNELIVSCQAEGNSPFNHPDKLSLFAIAAELGGAGGIRSEGIEKIKKIREVCTLPIIGIIKDSFADGSVCITRAMSDIPKLINSGADLIAVDGTSREKNGLTGPDFIQFCKTQFPKIPIIADIATLDEALNCVEIGADAISTTLRGYTPDTSEMYSDSFDLEFLKLLSEKLPVGFPIIAEGKIKDLDTVKKINQIGVWCVVIGSAITRPVLITNNFVNAYKNF